MIRDDDTERKPATFYSMNGEEYKFHVDNLRDHTDDSYETSILNAKIENAMRCITPFLTKCLIKSQTGPGINYFKFLRNKKINAMKERGVNTNCEYHHISQSSFYWKKILEKVANKHELEKYSEARDILIVIQIPATSILSKEKYDVHAKIIGKNDIMYKLW